MMSTAVNRDTISPAIEVVSPTSPIPSELSLIGPPQNAVPDRKRRFASAVSAASSLSGHFRRGTASMKRLSCMQIFAIILCVTVNITAGAGQLFALNKLVASYKKGPKNINAIFSILTLIGVINAVLASIAFFIYALIRRPSLAFLKTKKANLLSFGMGFAIAMNGTLGVSAVPHVPEIIQAFLLSTTIIWTFVFVKVLFAEKRSYCSPFVLFSFLLSLGGIVVGSASKFSGAGAMTLDTGLWCLIFAAGWIPAALSGVFQSKYIREFTIKKKDTALSLAATKDENENLVSSDSKERSTSAGSDSATAKFAAFVFCNIWQCIMTFVLLPASAIPWFGTAKSLPSLGSGLSTGYRCTFDALPDYPGCSEVLLFFFVFNGAFQIKMITLVFLNYYSPAVASMIMQLSAPFAALMLIIFPMLNVSNKPVNVGESLGAVVLISLGAVIYTIWEESTRNEQKNKEEEEAASQDDLDSPAGSPVSDPGAPEL